MLRGCWMAGAVVSILATLPAQGAEPSPLPKAMRGVNLLPRELRHDRPARSAAEQEAWDEAIFRFYRVPVTDVSKLPKRPVQIDTREKHEYRTLVRHTANYKPSFAKDVSVYEIGCGAGCFLLSVVEASTGRSYLLPDVNTWNAYLVDEYRRDSRALHVVGIVGQAGAGDRWYVWQGGTLKLMRYEPLDPECFSVSKDEGYYDTAACHYVATTTDKAEARRKQREGL